MGRSSHLRRHAAGLLRELLEQFPITLVVGARQVGKTTFLGHELEGWSSFDLEDAATADLVSTDPALFLRDHPDRVWFDEAQAVPALFPALRVAVDRDRRPGRYLLSGSASGPLTREVSESLAGRAGVLDLAPLTLAELVGRPPSPFLGRLVRREAATRAITAIVEDREPASEDELRAAWFSGGFPEPALHRDPVRWRRWNDAYVRLVAERDLRTADAAVSPVAVRRLLRMLAARHGQQVSLAALGRDFGVSAKRTRSLLDLLEGSGLWRAVEPFHANVGKRLTRAARGWIADSGLLHALLDLRGPADLEVHPLLGASFEGYVLGELRSQAALAELAAPFMYYRTHAGAEVDLVLELEGRLLPIEIKRKAHVTAYDLRGLQSFLETFGSRAPFGVVICRTERAARLTERIVAFPILQVV